MIPWAFVMAAMAQTSALAADPSPAVVEATVVEGEGSVPTEQVAASYVLKVASRQEASDALVAEARRLGGWFASLDDEAVALRVPADKAPELLPFVESLGLVAERDYHTQDVRQALAILDARIESRRELLDQYLGLLDGADAKAVLQLEREITSTIAVVESLEGQRRRMVDTAAIARVHVMFQFRDRRRSGAAAPSPFRWINELSVNGVEDDLRTRWSTADKRTGLPPVEVEGFANYKMKRESRAASPDGVVVRSRAVKHKPKAELDYWAEAVQTHLVGQGYTLLAEEDLQGARWLEWAIPVGQEDHTYAIVLHPSGGRIELVEAAGESEAFMGHREAVLAGVRAALE